MTFSSAHLAAGALSVAAAFVIGHAAAQPTAPSHMQTPSSPNPGYVQQAQTPAQAPVTVTVKQKPAQKPATQKQTAEKPKTSSVQVVEPAAETETVKPAVKPTSQLKEGRTGAVCKDGSTSTATGSGACSSHGGVATWTY